MVGSSFVLKISFGEWKLIGGFASGELNFRVHQADYTACSPVSTIQSSVTFKQRLIPVEDSGYKSKKSDCYDF
jgi:hypothetical protein